MEAMILIWLIVFMIVVAYFVIGIVVAKYAIASKFDEDDPIHLITWVVLWLPYAVFSACEWLWLTFTDDRFFKVLVTWINKGKPNE